MKKSLILTLILALLLSGCTGTDKIPESLEADGKIYKTGFYGNYFLEEYEHEGTSFEAEYITLTKIKHDKFRLYQAKIGPKEGGVLYCAEEDFEEAQKYYQDPKNYTYRCVLFVPEGMNLTQNIELTDVDTQKFDALLSFMDENAYDPFNSKHNSKVEKIEMPMPDEDKDIEMIFYKRSLDGLFTTTKGNSCYIIDNSLYLLFYFDYGYGEYEKMFAVKFPHELSSYFVAYMEKYYNAQ